MGAKENLRTAGGTRAVAAWLVAVVAASTLLFAAPASAAPVFPANGGGLDWGLKESFRNYITGPIATGSITVDGGATRNPDGTFHFPVAGATTYDQGTGALTSAFGGAVHFRGHGGQLELHISDLRITATTTSGQLLADVVSLPLATQADPDPEPVTYADVVLADLGPFTLTTANPATFTDVAATLAAGGAPAFEGFYEAGESLDAADVSVLLADELTVAEGLSWRVSSQLFTSSSLAGAHPLSASPTVKVPGDALLGTTGAAAGHVVHGAFVLPEARGVRYNPATGALQADFPGSLVFGNVAQGGYRIRFENLRLRVAAGGDGQLLADVAYALCFGPDGTTPANPCPLVPAPGGNAPVYVPTVADVVIADFTVGPVTDTGSRLTFTATPEFILRTDLAPESNPDGFRQFPQPLLDVFPASLVGHFRQTATGQDAKAPSPITVNIAYPTRTADERYVEQLYANLLDRLPDAAGLAFWTGRVASHGPASVVADLLRLPEPAGEIVDAVYDQYLGRGPDAGGRSFWVGRLVAGDTVESIERFFLTSPEATTGVTNQGYVDYLYSTILRRPASGDESQGWVAALDGGTPKLAVVNAILASRESAELRVRLVYAAILDRGPDGPGLDFWATQFQAQGSRLALLAQLASSSEYRSVLAPALRPAGNRLPVAFPPAPV